MSKPTQLTFSRAWTLASAAIAASLALHVGLSAQDGGVLEDVTAEIETARFAWPLPCKVLVEETALKGGKTMVMRYEVSLRREASEATEGGAESKHLLVSLRNFEFLKLDDKDLQTDEMRRQLGPALALAAAIPDLVIDERGKFVKTSGSEAMIERVIEAQVGVGGGHDDEAQQRMRAMLSSPAMKASVEASARLFWDAWVGAWAAWSVAPLEKTEEATWLPIGQQRMPATVVATHHGAVDKRPGFVKLSMETRASSDEAREAYAKFLTEVLGASVKDKKAFDKDKIRSLDIRSRVEVVTRLDSLRLFEASYEKRHTIEVEGQKPQLYHEKRSYKFKWAD